MCQPNEPGIIVELKIDTSSPLFSKIDKHEFFNNLKSEIPLFLSIILPNQTKTKALLQQQNANNNKDSLYNCKLIEITTYPSWLAVEQANNFLPSVWKKPKIDELTVVKKPKIKSKYNKLSLIIIR